jgi:hypothetical protein
MYDNEIRWFIVDYVSAALAEDYQAPAFDGDFSDHDCLELSKSKATYMEFSTQETKQKDMMRLAFEVIPRLAIEQLITII